MLSNMRIIVAVAETDTLARPAGNDGRYTNVWLLRTLVRRDQETDQGMGRQVGCAQFHKDSAGANVPYRAGDSFSTRIFNVDVLAG
jgi:hypothetical protein